MATNITLRYIKQNWNPTGRGNGSRAFCLRILPDVYDAEQCENERAFYFNQNAGFAESTINALMRGNRRSNTDFRFASTGFTKDFLDRIRSNSLIEYKNPEKSSVPIIENMLSKIQQDVQSMGAPTTKNHPLFAHMQFEPVGETDEETAKEFQAVRQAIEELAEAGTPETVSYGIFLLVLTAILQDWIRDVKSLYAPEALAIIKESDPRIPQTEVPGGKFTSFADPDYMYKYNIYLYRESTGNLYEGGTLEFQHPENGRTEATMTLRDTISNPASDEKPLLRTYKGRPMLSREDHMVYLIMADETDSLAILTFKHTPFKFAPCYFRPGFLIKSSPETHYPQLQMVSIVSREIPENELAYTRGLLKLNGKQLMLTQRQLDLFKEEHKNESWMPDFLRNYEPMFESHKKEYFCFDENEILSCSISDLDPQERLKILLALRAVDSPNDRGSHKFLKCQVPENTHILMK